MKLPTSAQAPRTRKHAERNGWPPPLAWDDGTIDDPNAHPSGMAGDVTRTDQRAARAEHLRDLDERSAGLAEALRELDMTRDYLGGWCRRWGFSDVFHRMVERDQQSRKDVA